MKSCKKPTCQAIENQRQCLADLSNKVNATPAQSVNTAEADRAPASTAQAIRAGSIEDAVGDVKIAGRKNLRRGDVVNIGDRIETGPAGKARIRLEDGSKLMIASSSQVIIDTMDIDAAQKKRRIAMSLLSGKVRNRVEKYPDQGNAFEVKTRTAVAGVRGTDFVTSFDA
ncbi:MAG TPA: FecR family protein, partial [Bdellovibrionales bacterium]|nr:FecR family protein [Bdellovibrionales bacterium]